MLPQKEEAEGFDDEDGSIVEGVDMMDEMTDSVVLIWTWLPFASTLLAGGSVFLLLSLFRTAVFNCILPRMYRFFGFVQ